MEFRHPCAISSSKISRTVMGLISRPSLRRKRSISKRASPEKSKADEVTEPSIFAHHHGFKSVNVGTTDFISLLYLHRVPNVHEFHFACFKRTQASYLASIPVRIPSPSANVEPTLPTTADLRVSPARSRNRNTASMPVQWAPSRLATLNSFSLSPVQFSC